MWKGPIATAILCSTSRVFSMALFMTSGIREGNCIECARQIGVPRFPGSPEPKLRVGQMLLWNSKIQRCVFQCVWLTSHQPAVPQNFRNAKWSKRYDWKMLHEENVATEIHCQFELVKFLVMRLWLVGFFPRLKNIVRHQFGSRIMKKNNCLHCKNYTTVDPKQLQQSEGGRHSIPDHMEKNKMGDKPSEAGTAFQTRQTH